MSKNKMSSAADVVPSPAPAPALAPPPFWAADLAVLDPAAAADLVQLWQALDLVTQKWGNAGAVDVSARFSRLTEQFGAVITEVTPPTGLGRLTRRLRPARALPEIGTDLQSLLGAKRDWEAAAQGKVAQMEEAVQLYQQAALLVPEAAALAVQLREAAEVRGAALDEALATESADQMLALSESRRQMDRVAAAIQVILARLETESVQAPVYLQLFAKNLGDERESSQQLFAALQQTSAQASAMVALASTQQAAKVAQAARAALPRPASSPSPGFDKSVLTQWMGTSNPEKVFQRVRNDLQAAAINGDITEAVARGIVRSLKKLDQGDLVTVEHCAVPIDGVSAPMCVRLFTIAASGAGRPISEEVPDERLLSTEVRVQLLDLVTASPSLTSLIMLSFHDHDLSALLFNAMRPEMGDAVLKFLDARVPVEFAKFVWQSQVQQASWTAAVRPDLLLKVLERTSRFVPWYSDPADNERRWAGLSNPQGRPVFEGLMASPAISSHIKAGYLSALAKGPASEDAVILFSAGARAWDPLAPPGVVAKIVDAMRPEFAFQLLNLAAAQSGAGLKNSPAYHELMQGVRRLQQTLSMPLDPAGDTFREFLAIAPLATIRERAQDEAAWAAFARVPVDFTENPLCAIMGQGETANEVLSILAPRLRAFADVRDPASGLTPVEKALAAPSPYPALATLASAGASLETAQGSVFEVLSRRGLFFVSDLVEFALAAPQFPAAQLLAAQCCTRQDLVDAIVDIALSPEEGKPEPDLHARGQRALAAIEPPVTAAELSAAAQRPLLTGATLRTLAAFAHQNALPFELGDGSVARAIAEESAEAARHISAEVAGIPDSFSARLLERRDIVLAADPAASSAWMAPMRAHLAPMSSAWASSAPASPGPASATLALEKQEYREEKVARRVRF